ncbi:hypothetical protein EON65_52335 [archaeon]|nr:MAG: hypothetical protein EON65_52335 [archaeon]
MRLKSDLHLPAVHAVGTIVNDKLFNSYSLCDPALLIEAAVAGAGAAPAPANNSSEGRLLFYDSIWVYPT